MLRCDKFSGAGVFIIEVPDKHGELNIVLFHDKSKRAYADAGGKCELLKHNNDPLLTAKEELYEESATLIQTPDQYLSVHVEKIVGKKNKRYRAYFLLTEQLRRKDYLNNVNRLKKMNAAKYLQETNDMVRIPLSKLYRALMIDHPNKKSPKVTLKNGKRVKIHGRVSELMRFVFEKDPEWLLDKMTEKRFAKYDRVKDSDGLIHYTY